MGALHNALAHERLLPCRWELVMQKPSSASMMAGQARMHTSAPPMSEDLLT